MVQSKKWTSHIADFLIYAILAVVAIMCVAPIIHTFAVSFSNKALANAGFVYFWPKGFNLSSYEMLMQDTKFFRAFSISVSRVVIGCSLNFVLTVLTAYPLSKEKKFFPQRNFYMWFCLFTMLFSGGMIPVYMTVSGLGLLDTIWALVLPGAVPVYNIILLMNFFRGIPSELEEAAFIDGASPLVVLIRLYLPMSLPALATVTMFTIVGHWNSFFDGLIYMNKPINYPLQSYIQQMVVVMQQDMSTMSPEEIKRLSEISNQTLNAAKIVVSMVPVMAIYPFMQKFFIHGITLGSVKE